MTTPQKSLPEREDGILKKIFLISLISNNRDPRVVYLEFTAAALLSEDTTLLLHVDMIERALSERLTDEVAYEESPFRYLVECYARACDELRKIASIKDQTILAGLESAIRKAKKLIISYARDRLGKLRDSSLLPLLLREFSNSIDGCGGSITDNQNCSTEFIEEFFRDAEYEALEPVLNWLYEDLRRSVINVSVLGNFEQPLSVLKNLVCRYPNCAKALVNHPSWMAKGDHVDGRVIEMTSILGAFFHVSALPDVFESEPDVGEQCFTKTSARGKRDILSSFTTIRTQLNNLYDGLTTILISLLKNKETRESVKQYLAEMIKKNSLRAHSQVNPLTSASSGFFVNLSVVMVRLCEPFLDVKLTKRDKIDPTYLLTNTCLDLRKLTTLHTSSEEVAAWVRQNSRDNQKVEHGFICESFFMTARVLNLGLLKAYSELKDIAGHLVRSKDTLASLKKMQGQSPSQQVALDIAQEEEKIELYKQTQLCYEAQVLHDVAFLKRVLEFYRLMIIRLVDIVGGIEKPLPSKCDMLFACFPESFIEDAMELLIVASHVPTALDGVSIVDFINFIIVFIARPEYIRSPYLRAKMVEVLNCWIPKTSEMSSMSIIFEGYPFCVEHLVRNLLELYVEVELTGNQFYDKFSIRRDITKLLRYLWNIPAYRHKWINIAKEEEKGVYLNFLNFLINDLTYLLDESLNKIRELKGLQASTTEWEGRPSQERSRRAQELRHEENNLKIKISLAMEDMSLVEFTTEYITAPFLRPEMVERVANMLNYFLLKLAGPQRNSFSFKGNEKCDFRPKELLTKIFRIYIHLARGDGESVFSAAISSDGRSYNEDLFTAAADILRRIGEDSEAIQEFVNLGERAKVAAFDALDDEAALGDIPEDFIDPIQCTLMKDPVILPTSNINMDRSVIERHLLSHNSDPFNRLPLTQGMLLPNAELKVKIDKFVKSRVEKRHIDGL